MDRNFIKIKSGLLKILFLAIGWGISGAVFAINEYMSVAHSVKDLGINFEFNFRRNLVTSVFMASVGGILIGAIEVFYFQKKPKTFIWQSSFDENIFLFSSIGIVDTLRLYYISQFY